MNQIKTDVQTEATSEVVPEKNQHEESVDQALEETKESIQEIRQTVADKVTELEELQKATEEDSTEKENRISELEKQVGELQAELSKEKADKEDFAKQLREIEEENLLEVRLTRLNTAKLLRSSEDAQCEQALKVTAMSEEDFDAYVIELEDIYRQAAGISQKQEEAAKEQEEADKTTEVIDEISKDVSENIDTAASDVEVDQRLERTKKFLALLAEDKEEATPSEEEEEDKEVDEGSETASTPLKETASEQSPTVDLFTAGFKSMLSREDI